MHHTTTLFVLLSVAVMAALTTLTTPLSAALQSSYVIRSRPIEDIAEALKLLRRFMPGEPNSPERCEKYAVLIHALSTSKVDQFAVSDLALSNRNGVKNRMRSIDVESLRRAYIEGIQVFNNSELDPALLELVTCLSDRFKAVDARARSFLNNRELQNLVGQYASILNQPLDFLLDPNVKHPNLSNAQLKPTVRQTLERWFNGDEAQVEARFAPFAAQAPLRPAAVALASSNAARAVAEVPQLPPAAPELTPEEQAYLDNLSTALQHVYQATIPATKLNDRCQVYTKVFELDKSNINEATIESLAKEARERVAQSGPTKAVYTPDKKARENYLFALSTFGPNNLGDETWIDLVDCLSQWESIDPEVKSFMHAPELEQIFREILAKTEANSNVASGGVTAPVGTAAALPN